MGSMAPATDEPEAEAEQRSAGADGTPPGWAFGVARRPDEGHIGGVCAGIADRLGIDVTLVRLLAIAFAFTGPGVPVYLGAWILLPTAGDGGFESPDRSTSVLPETTTLVGGALVAVAALIVFDGWFGFDQGWVFPLGLMAVGGYLLLRDHPGRDDAGRDDSDYDPWASTPASTPASTTSPIADPPPPEPAATDTPSPFREVRPWWSDEVEPPADPPKPPEPGELDEEREGAWTSTDTLILGVVAVAAGVLALLHTNGVVEGGLPDVLATAVVVLGGLLVVTAWYGRARWLIAPAVGLTVVLSAATAVDIPLSGGVGERGVAPADAAAIEPYELAVGELRLDLTGLDADDLAALDGPVEAQIGLGSLQVTVPEDVTVAFRGRVAMGTVVIDGDEVGGGFDLDEQRTLGEGSPDVVLDLGLAVGEMEVSVE